jgi:hypothetical protein
MIANLTIPGSSVSVAKLKGGCNKTSFTLLCLLLTGLLLQSHSVLNAQSKRKKAKAEKAALAKLKGDIGHHLTQLHAIEHENVPAYFQMFLQKNNISPLVNDSFVDSFEVDEGYDFRNNNTNVSLNGIQLTAGTDFYPFSFSGNAQISGEAAPALNEKGAPWFYNLGDVWHDHAKDSSFNLTDYCLQKAKRAASKGATAVLFYNLQNDIPSEYIFSPLHRKDSCLIPIVYVTKAGWKKCNADEVSTMDIDVSINIQPKKLNGINYAGFINHRADTTLVLYSKVPVEGLATLLSMAPNLHKLTHLNYAIVYQPQSKYSLTQSSLLTQIQNIHPQHYILGVEILADTTQQLVNTDKPMPFQFRLNVESTKSNNSENSYIPLFSTLQYVLNNTWSNATIEEQTNAIEALIEHLQTLLDNPNHYLNTHP